MERPIDPGDGRRGGRLDLASPGMLWRVALLVGLALAAVYLVVTVLWLLAHTLALLLAALVIAVALAPLVDQLERWLPRAAVLALYVALLALLGATGWLLVPGLAGQAQELVAGAPALVDQGEELAGPLEDTLPVEAGRIEDAVEQVVQRFGAALVSLPFTVVSVAAEMLLVLTMSAYLLVAGPALHRFVLSFVPPARREAAAAVLAEMGRTMGGYVRAEAIVAGLVGAVTYVGLRLIGVDYPLVLALVAGLGELVPIAGPILSAVPALVVALLESPTQALLVLAFFVGLQQLESNILLPLIMRRQADIPPLLTLVALAAGAALGGIFGALLAIPVAGALRVFVLRVAAPALRGWTGAATPAADGDRRVGIPE